MPSLPRRIGAWFATGPAWSLPTYLGIALLLRVPAMLFADGHEFVDQQFQYVDPAWHLASGDDWTPTWEWPAGMRSWVYPGFLAAVFRVLMALGFDEPLTMMRGVRAVNALISLLPVWLFWLVATRWRPFASPRLPLLLFAGSGLLVTVGVQPSGPAFGATLAVAGVLAFHGPRGFPVLGGLLLGLAFCGRYQEALFGPAVVAVGLAQRRFGAVAWFALGCAPGILLQGFVDLAVTGQFLGGPWSYFRENVLNGAAAQFHTQPWYFYLPAVAIVVMLLPPWFGIAWRRLLAGTGILPAALAAGVLHVAAHSFIARKALRFEYGALCLLLAVIAAGLGTVPAGRWAAAHRRALLVGHAIAFAWASFGVGNAGPIEAAELLRRQALFRGDLIVVDGGQTSIGGAFYLRRDSLHYERVASADVLARLAGDQDCPGFVVTVRRPLAADVAARCRLEQLGAFTGQFDRRHRERRWVYKRVR